MANKRGSCATTLRLLRVSSQNSPPIIKQEPKQMPDLIDDGTWREAALARMSEVFVTNRGLRPVFADGERAPLRHRLHRASPGDRARRRARTHTSQGPSAPLFKSSSARAKRDVMLSYGLPLPLRLLDGRVLTSSRATAIRRLAPRPVARQIAARGRLCAGRGWSRPGTA
jgi:hypothetical protein